MRYIKRILPVLLIGMILTGCGENTYRAAVQNLQDGKYDTAVEQFETAIKEEKNVGDSYRGIGLACWEQEKYEEAASAFENALKNGAKETGTIYNLLGTCQMKSQNYEKAIESYEKGCEQADSTDEMIREMKFNVIVSFEKLKDWESAKQKLADYVESYPEDEAAKKEVEFLKTR